MSYSRSYHRTITVHGSESKVVSYPKSDTGGNMTVTVNYTENVPVDIDIYVDTNPFDTSISSTKRQVNLLTGSVVATETAHIASKVKSSSKVSDSIIKGFFGLIKSEINQQLTELKPLVETRLIEMMQYLESCVLKKKQLESDFGRISERYSKIFIDLDKELRNRILVLNQSAVAVHATLINRVHRTFSDIGTSISTIYNKEESNLQSILFASNLKKRALTLIDSAANYLLTEKNLSKQLKQILFAPEIRTIVTKHLPVVLFEAKNSSKANDVQIISPELIPSSINTVTKLKEGFANSDNNWKVVDPKSREQINTFLKLQISAENKKINSRVGEQIMRLWEQNTHIQTNA